MRLRGNFVLYLWSFADSAYIFKGGDKGQEEQALDTSITSLTTESSISFVVILLTKGKHGGEKEGVVCQEAGVVSCF